MFHFLHPKVEKILQLKKKEGEFFNSLTHFNSWVDYLKLLLIYKNFINLVLLIVFISSAYNPSLLSMVQLSLCLVYLNLDETLTWYATKAWIWLGIYYYAEIVLQVRL